MEAKIAAAKVQTDLQNVSDSELVEIYAALKGNDTYKVQFNKLMHVAGPRLKDILERDERSQHNSGGAASVNSGMEQTLATNLQNLEAFSQVNPLDEKNKEFATSRQCLTNMVVIDEQGKEVDVKSNIIEVAKLKTVADLCMSPEPISQEVYNNRLRDNLDLSIYGIMMTDLATKPNSSPKNLQASLDALLDGKKQIVSTNSVSGILGGNIVTLTNFADSLVNKFKNLNLAQKFKTKIAQANESLTQKLKDTYVKARTYAQVLQEQGVWADVGMAFVAGAGGPVGMAAYGAWTYYRRVHPLYKAYKEEKGNNPEMKNFWQYIKSHKKDATFAGLYMLSSVASFGAAGAAIGQAFAQTNTVAQAAGNAFLHAKSAIAYTMVGSRCATDIAQAWGTPDMGKALKRSLISMGMCGVGYNLAHYVAEHAGNTDIVDNAPNQTPIKPVIPWQNDSIQGDYQPAEPTMHGSDTVILTDSNDALKGGANVAEPTMQGSRTVILTDSHDALNGGEEAATATNHEYTVGTREQIVYERNLRIVKDSDIMVANVKDGIVELPKGMTPEMAVNLARVNSLYYGDNTGLYLLKDCDEVSKISSVEYFNKIAAKFTDSCSDPHGVGFPTDPKYYANPNIYTSSIEVDCGKVTLIGGHTNPNPIVTPTPETTPAPETTPTPTVTPAPEPVAPIDLVDDTVPDVEPTPISTAEQTQPVQDTPLEQPHLKGVGGNTPLNENINEEASRIGARELGADGDGNIVRVDTEQNHSQPEKPKVATPTSGKGSESLHQALMGKRINTFDM